MKNLYSSRLGEKRFKKRLKRKKKKKILARTRNHIITKRKEAFDDDFSLKNLYDKLLPSSSLYLLNHPKANFFREGNTFETNSFEIPEVFSLSEAPDETYDFISKLFTSLILQKHRDININYEKCRQIDIGAQVLLDVILSDYIKFLKRCDQRYITNNIGGIGGSSAKNNEINKLLYSVGSPAIFSKKTRFFSDVIPYNLRIRDREETNDPVKIQEKKDIDTTTLADYVLACLSRMNKQLTPESLDDLCTVIGEILINAEEHSTINYRYSVGYFIESNEDNVHTGIFHLVIFNFGQTIYEKFIDPNCPTPHIVKKMERLSRFYSLLKFFRIQTFEEETLWTLYALQEGVTSKANYKRRGNGSIQFIESFFNLGGENANELKESQMTMLSGNTKIVFDGTYSIAEKTNEEGERFKVMTFNESGDIEKLPDGKYVSYVKHYFPGTMIHVKLKLKEEDLIKSNE